MNLSIEKTTPSANHGCTLVVMAKAPKPGMVKTRLTRSLSVEAATELYRCLLDDTIALARSLSGVNVSILCPAPDREDLVQLVCGEVDVVAQKGDGLAAGLTSVFAHFTAPGAQRVVAFNSDSPHLPASILEGAFEALTDHDVVVGPTHDGGYYLVGAKAAHPALFDGDGMGTKSAFDGLLARARGLQLSMGFTDPFYDVDVEGDLTRLAAELRIAPARAPRTAAWLEQWGQAAAQLRAATETR
ncbi:MAG: TIGR04282 family arsenosugar biosynthesis glycosyltransferase [Candidatus Acidiferrales bacterium]